MELSVQILERVPYGEGLAIQSELRKARQHDYISDTLLLLEHDPVITCGKRTLPEHFLVSPELLGAQGLPVELTDRGGQATWHGPGQLIGYIIADLKCLGLDIRSFVHCLEEVLIRLLRNHYTLSAGRNPDGNGIWINNRKIGSLGISIKKGVTMHGLALNNSCRLDGYHWIIPCGLPRVRMTTLARETGMPADRSMLQNQVVESFCNVFGYTARIKAGV